MSVISIGSRVIGVNGVYSVAVEVTGFATQGHADRALALLHAQIRSQAQQIDALEKESPK